MKKKCDNHTFVVCAYKESTFLEECIQSLLNQTIESNIIISTSTPNQYIQNIAEKYNLPLFSHCDGGIGKDWNFGLSQVNTQYATIAHQDDIYLPEYLESCLNMFLQNEDVLIAFTDYNELKNGIVISKNRNLKIKRLMLFPFKIFKRSRFVRNRVFSMGSPICCPAVSLNLKLIDDFQFSTKLSVNLDWEAWYRIGQYKGAFAYIDTPLMYHRIHDGSETSNAIGDNRRRKEDLLMFEKYWPKVVAKFIYRFYSKSEDSNQ